jgi:hypothetical protein
MKKISVKEYARLNRVSIYQVIKKVQRGELQGVTLEENGVKVNYVVLDEEGESPGDRPKEKEDETMLPAAEDWKKEADLADEIRRLREEVARLRAVVERCCG